jgi:CBS domain-containing protein
MSIIREVLNRKGDTVITVPGQTTVLEAIATMSEANIGAVVIQDGEQPAGIFTERDYLRRISLEGRASSDTAISDVMSSPLITAPSTESNRAAMETMTERRCRHLVIVDDGTMIGIVSMGDLVKHLLLEAQAEVEQLSSYIAGSY